MKVQSPSIDTREEAIAAATYLLATRGYVVLRTIPSCQWTPGEIVHCIWRIDVGQPFQVMAETNHLDWEEQKKIVAPHLGRPFHPTPNRDERFWRAVTD